MHRWLSRAVTIGLLSAGGCGLPETRYLSWYPRPAGQEVRSYNLHDPFPNEDAGPETATRPRQFTDPRNETRRNQQVAQVEMQRQAMLARGQPGLPRGTISASALPAGAVVVPTNATPTQFEMPVVAQPSGDAPVWSPQ